MNNRVMVRAAFANIRFGNFIWRGVSICAIAFLIIGMLIGAAVPASQKEATPSDAGGLAGQFLVASEVMDDPRFAQTVILMIRHDAGGAIGIIVNRPMGKVTIAKLLEDVGLGGIIRGETLLHYGGPLEQYDILTLHTSDYKTEGTLRVGKRMAMTESPDVLRAIGTGGGPKRFLVAQGHAGWFPGQLEAEITAGLWLNVPADEALTFDENDEKKWGLAISLYRIDL